MADVRETMDEFRKKEDGSPVTFLTEAFREREMAEELDRLEEQKLLRELEEQTGHKVQKKKFGRFLWSFLSRRVRPKLPQVQFDYHNQLLILFLFFVSKNAGNELDRGRTARSLFYGKYFELADGDFGDGDAE